MKYNFFPKKVTIFEYDPIVQTGYVFSYMTNYLYHLTKGLLIAVFIAYTFYQKITVVRLYLG